MLRIFIMQVLASQLHFFANKNAESAAPSLGSLSKRRFCQHGRQPEVNRVGGYKWRMMTSAVLV